jgi:hypothetical protein
VEENSFILGLPIKYIGVCMDNFQINEMHNIQAERIYIKLKNFVPSVPP